MKKKTSAIITLIILLAIAGFFYFSNPKSTIGKKATSFSLDDTSGISKILIKKADTVLKLEKTDGAWTVNDAFPAKSRSVKYLLEALKRIKTKAPVPKSFRQKLLRDLREKGMQIIVFQGDRVVYNHYIFLDKTKVTGTIMVSNKSSHPFSTYIPELEVPLAALFINKKNFWRANTLLPYSPNEIEHIRISYFKQKKQGFLIRKNSDSDGFQLYDKYGNTQINADQEKINTFLSRLENIGYTYIPVKEITNSDSLINHTPEAKIFIKTKSQADTIVFFNRFISTKNENKLDFDNLYAKKTNNSPAVLVKYIDLSMILKEAEYFYSSEKMK